MHFSVDGTLLQAWASHASLERIDGQVNPPPPPSGPGEGFGAPKPGRKRAKTGERDAANVMAADRPGAHQKTIGADKNYDTKGFVAEMRRIGVTLHVAQNTARSDGSAIDGRTTRHEQRQVDPRPPRHREGVRLDQTVGWAASVQAARHRNGGCSVWPAPDRLQPDPAGQPAQTGDADGMSSKLPRGVARQWVPERSNGPESQASGHLSP